MVHKNDWFLKKPMISHLFFSFSFLFFLSFFFFCLFGMWKFLGQGSNLHHGSNPSCYSDNTRSLTCCATKELQTYIFFQQIFICLNLAGEVSPDPNFFFSLTQFSFFNSFFKSTNLSPIYFTIL